MIYLHFMNLEKNIGTFEKIKLFIPNKEKDYKIMYLTNIIIIRNLQENFQEIREQIRIMKENFMSPTKKSGRNKLDL